MAYITEGDLENLILQDIDTTYSAWIADVIAMVEAWIDQYTGRDFSSVAGNATRYYDGTGTGELIVDNLTAITALAILDVNGNTEQTLASTDYYTAPYNETVKTKIVLAPGGSLGVFPDRVRAVAITGTFGIGTVPAPVKLAAMQLAAKIINEGLRGGQVSSESLGSYNINYREVDEKAESLGILQTLNMYRQLGLD